MSEDKKTIQEALAEVQRKVNEERTKQVVEMYSSLDEALGSVNLAGKKQSTTGIPKKPAVNQNVPGSKPPSTSGVETAANIGAAASVLPKQVVGGAMVGAGAAELGKEVAFGSKTARDIGHALYKIPGVGAASDMALKAREALGIPSTAPKEYQRTSADIPKPTSGGISPAPAPAPKPDKPTSGGISPAPKAAPKADDSFAATFKRARETSGGSSTGQFSWHGKDYQTNIKGSGTADKPQEKYVAPSAQTKTGVDVPKPASTEDGKKKKMSEDTNSLIASFLALQEKNAQNMFVEAKKLSKKQKEKMDVDDDNDIDADDLSKLRSKKVEEGNVENIMNPKSEWAKKQAADKNSPFNEPTPNPTDVAPNIMLRGKTQGGSPTIMDKVKSMFKEGNVDPVVTGSSSVTKSKTGYVDPSTPKVPYSELPKPGNAAGDVLDKAKNALDKKGVKEETEEEVTFSQAEIDHINSFFLESSVAPNRPEVATGADSTSDKMSQNDVTGTAESGKRKVKEEEVERLEETPTDKVLLHPGLRAGTIHKNGDTEYNKQNTSVYVINNNKPKDAASIKSQNPHLSDEDASHVAKHYSKGLLHGSWSAHGNTRVQSGLPHATSHWTWSKSNKYIKQNHKNTLNNTNEEVELDEVVRVVDPVRRKYDPKHGIKDGSFQGKMERFHLAKAAKDRRKLTHGSGVSGFNSAMDRKLDPETYKNRDQDTGSVRAVRKEEVEVAEDLGSAAALGAALIGTGAGTYLGNKLGKKFADWKEKKAKQTAKKPVKEETLEEGRPRKNPTPETTERDPRQHIQVQAGRAAAGNVVDFHHNDGSKSKITPAMGRRITSHLNSLKPADRQSAVNKMHDSAEGLKV